jgi:hypothetical protein
MQIQCFKLKTKWSLFYLLEINLAIDNLHFNNSFKSYLIIKP